MIFEWMSDPSAWVGLLTLVVLEIVLGIDNLVFIAILAEKLPPEQRNTARVVGLILALLMRLVLLASIAWVVTLTEPLFHIFDHPFSGRDLILLFGGVFLLFKGTMELHERIDAKVVQKEESPANAVFWMVIVQIVVLDAVFSLDSVITAVGMVKHLSVMMIAVIIAVGIMLWASKALMEFVNKHPTVVILCLGFLMMIGFSLIVEGFGFHIPKGYLYAAIGFSVIVEFINQTMRRNQEKMVTTTDLRYKTASAVLRMLGGKSSDHASEPEDVLATRAYADEVFDPENGVYHSVLVQGVLGLSERPVKSVMTPRPELEWIDLEDEEASIKSQLLSITHSRLIVARGELDNIAGVVLTHKVLNEYGSIEGIATPIDVLEAIAGEFPDEDAEDNVAESLEDGSLMLDGSTDIRHVSLLLDRDLVDESDQYSTLSGYILFHLGRLPENGSSLEADGCIFEVVTMDGHKIEKVHVIPKSDLHKESS